MRNDFKQCRFCGNREVVLLTAQMKPLENSVRLPEHLYVLCDRDRGGCGTMYRLDALDMRDDAKQVTGGNGNER